MNQRTTTPKDGDDPRDTTVDAATVQALQDEIQRLHEEIDERRSFAQVLQRRLDFLNQIVESMPFPLYVVDAADYKVQIANSAAKTGRLTADVTCHALTHGSDVPCSSEGHPCPLRSVVHSKRPMVVEHVHLDAEKKPRDVQVHAFPILGRDGEVVQMVEFCLDVSDHRQTERERDQLAERLQELLGSG